MGVASEDFPPDECLTTFDYWLELAKSFHRGEGVARLARNSPTEQRGPQNCDSPGSRAVWTESVRNYLP